MREIPFEVVEEERLDAEKLGRVVPKLVAAQNNSDMSSVAGTNWSVYCTYGISYIVRKTVGSSRDSILISEDFAHQLKPSVVEYRTFDEPANKSKGSRNLSVCEAFVYTLMPPHVDGSSLEKIVLLATPATLNDRKLKADGGRYPEWYQVLRADLQLALNPALVRKEVYATVSFIPDKYSMRVHPPTLDSSQYCAVKKYEVYAPSPLLVEYVKNSNKNLFGLEVVSEDIPEWKTFLAPKGG